MCVFLKLSMCDLDPPARARENLVILRRE